MHEITYAEESMIIEIRKHEKENNGDKFKKILSKLSITDPGLALDMIGIIGESLLKGTCIMKRKKIICIKQNIGQKKNSLKNDVLWYYG